MIDLSLNEVETLAAKAARGAGLPWGVAEDTGRAAAWIARRVEDWATLLLALLEQPGKPSPLLVAGWLADADQDCRFERVKLPLWALPGLLSMRVRAVSIALDAAWQVGCNAGGEIGATAPIGELAALACASIAVRFADPPPMPHILAPRFTRSPVPAPAWERLQALAYRTYVPASDHSRRTGAGAGRLDDA